MYLPWDLTLTFLFISEKVFSFILGILSWNFSVGSSVSILSSLNLWYAFSPSSYAEDKSLHIYGAARRPVDIQTKPSSSSAIGFTQSFSKALIIDFTSALSLIIRVCWRSL